MDTNKKIREYISAFADGELPDADLELALAALHEADGREAWDLYHRIGDSLRNEPAELSPGFALRLADRLAAEPMPLRSGAVPQASAANALAAIAPVVVAGAEPLDGSKLAGQGVASHKSAAAGAVAGAAAGAAAGTDLAPAAVKRL